MNIIEQSAEIIEQKPGISGLYEHIERVGRTCYKSEDYMKEGSSERFVKQMIKNGHTAMLEHGTLYLYFKHDPDKYPDDGDPFDVSLNLTLNPYTQSNHNWDTHEVFYTTNLRVIVEMLPDQWEQFIAHHMVDYDDRFIKRTTIKCITDRGVSHELVRHRVFSFAQESQRYCNYSKDKFNRSITFIKPVEFKFPAGRVYYHDGICWRIEKEDGETISVIRGNIEDEPVLHSFFFDTLKMCERTYFELLKKGYTPQTARSVLPNSTKTEICMTGSSTQWDGFLDLRYKETTGKVSPQMKDLSTKINKLINGEDNI